MRHSSSSTPLFRKCIFSYNPVQKKNQLLLCVVSFMLQQMTPEPEICMLGHVGLIMLEKFTDGALIAPLITYHLSVGLMCILDVFMVYWEII